jgi:hypothetical protein
MHPDLTIEALKTEKRRYPERASEIDVEIERVKLLPKPKVILNQNTGVTVVNRQEAYLAGLRKELERHPEKVDEIQAEIDRAEGKHVGLIERAVTAHRGKQKAVTSTDPED